MNTIDWTKRPREQVVRHDNHGLTHSAARVLVGNCPDCGTVLVVFNDHESWPLVACACNWRGDTLSLSDGRLYRHGEPAEVL